jgi:hypothetical protein
LKKPFLRTILLIALLVLSGCETEEIIELEENLDSKYNINTPYRGENTDTVLWSECVDLLMIYPGGDGGKLIDYTYNGGGLLSDPDGNIYHYDADGYIYNKKGDPTRDRLEFIPLIGCKPGDFLPMTYAQIFDDNITKDENQAGDGMRASNAVGVWGPSTTNEVSCYGNLIWEDFFPNAPNINALAHIDPSPVPFLFDFDEGTISGNFCGEAKYENDGFKTGEVSFCATITSDQLVDDEFGGWDFDGSFQVEMDFSASTLTWIDGEQVWVHNSQTTRIEVPFHGWLNAEESSLYADESYPATFQYLCDFYPPEQIFNP